MFIYSSIYGFFFVFLVYRYSVGIFNIFMVVIFDLDIYVLV